MRPLYWRFSFRTSPSSEYSCFISFRIDWLDLLAFQGTSKSLLQHHSSKASILWCPAFFTVQLSHLYITYGKTIALTIWTFASKVISLLFNSFVIAFLPRSKPLLSPRFNLVWMYRGQIQHQAKQFYVMQIYSKRAQQKASSILRT